MNIKAQRLLRAKILLALSRDIDHRLSLLAKIAKAGFRVKTRNGQEVFLHLLLAPLVVNHSETKDLLGMELAFQTLSPFCTCFAKEEDFLYSTNAGKQSLTKTKKFLDSHTSSTEELAEHNRFKTFMANPSLPVLSLFSTIGILQCVKLYIIFRLKPMHVFSLGSSKLWRDVS